MKLRKLKPKDIPLILEWMQDMHVARFFRFAPQEVTKEAVEVFVSAAQEAEKNLHLACVDDADEYLGTVSLKDIDREAQHAEYAIAFRKSAQGTGAARYATRRILQIAFERMQLHRVYLNVLEENHHARNFYEKSGFMYEGISREHLFLRGEWKNLIWYGILAEEYDERYKKCTDA